MYVLVYYIKSNFATIYTFFFQVGSFKINFFLLKAQVGRKNLYKNLHKVPTDKISLLEEKTNFARQCLRTAGPSHRSCSPTQSGYWAESTAQTSFLPYRILTRRLRCVFVVNIFDYLESKVVFWLTFSTESPKLYTSAYSYIVTLLNNKG